MKQKDWKPVLTMRWKHLLFVHWRVPPSLIRPLIPPPLEVDTYEGDAWVAFVPFVMESVRPVWVPPIPRLFDFGEVNVRTYVRYQGERGVWFFSLDASHRLAVWVARQYWRLPYYPAHIRLIRKGADAFEYLIQRRASEPVGAIACYRISGEPRETEPGSLAHFLVERYTLFTGGSNTLYRAQVAHVPYRVQPATLVELRENLLAHAGIALPNDSEPVVFYAPGFGVLASKLEPVLIPSSRV